jgi:hypothetical protein
MERKLFWLLSTDVPRSNSDIGLNSHDALLVEHRMSLTDELHDLIPGTIECCASAVHGVVDATLPDQPLHFRYLC